MYGGGGTARRVNRKEDLKRRKEKCKDFCPQPKSEINRRHHIPENEDGLGPHNHI